MLRSRLSILAVVVVFTQPAHALTLSVHAGPSGAVSRLPLPAEIAPPRVLSPRFGMEVTSGIKGLFEAGFFYDRSLQISSASLASEGGSVSFYGGIARTGLNVISSAFIELRAGFTSSTYELLRSETSFGAGAGLGYRQELAPFLTLSPRLGYRWLPQGYVGGPGNGAVTFVDFDLLLSLEF